MSTFATVYYQYVILSILHKECYKTTIAKRFLSSREHMGFLTRSIIYMQPGTRPIRSRPIYYNTNTLPEISSSGIFWLSCKYGTTKQNSYPTPSTFKGNPDLQPVTCNLQFTPSGSSALLVPSTSRGNLHVWTVTLYGLPRRMKGYSQSSKQLRF